jgi:predicted transposase YdaD
MTTDNPFKRLFSDFIMDFAIWLLGDNIRQVSPLNVALPPSEEIRPDLVYQVTLTDGQSLILHIDFQGRTTHRPMPWRELDYISRLTEIHHLPVCSVVIYVGQDAGTNDMGQYQYTCPTTGDVILSWRYRVIRLWQLPAEDILKLERPALLPLVGQTQIQQPEQLLPEVVKRIRAIPDEEQQGRLLTALIALMNDEEMTTMIENLLEQDELLNTPYLRRIRKEGREEGREEGALSLNRRHILDIVTFRFQLSLLESQRLEQQLLTINNEGQLDKLFFAATRSEQLSAFQAVLNNFLH